MTLAYKAQVHTYNKILSKATYRCNGIKRHQTEPTPSSDVIVPVSVAPKQQAGESNDNDNDDDIIIKITPKAMDHLKFLKSKVGTEKVLRMGVRAGGCSGMSYVMDFIDNSEVSDDDQHENYDGVKCVIDPKSLLYLYGMELDYSDELIGGGFKFSNPNAESSCGCGKSFGV